MFLVQEIGSTAVMGGDLRGIRGNGPPQKCEVGDGPCIRPPNISVPPIFGEVVLYGSVRKYEKKTKQKCLCVK